MKTVELSWNDLTHDGETIGSNSVFTIKIGPTIEIHIIINIFHDDDRLWKVIITAEDDLRKVESNLPTLNEAKIKAQKIINELVNDMYDDIILNFSHIKF